MVAIAPNLTILVGELVGARDLAQHVHELGAPLGVHARRGLVEDLVGCFISQVKFSALNNFFDLDLHICKREKHNNIICSESIRQFISLIEL